MKLSTVIRGLVGCGVLLGQLARAGSFTLDFTEDPSTTGLVTVFGNAEWRDTGGNPGGYLKITDAVDSERSALVFEDLDNGLVVKAFSFSLDVRVGGGDEAPADGFSINFAREGDGVLDDGEGWASSPTGEANLPEEGTITGLAVGFDSWNSGAPDVIGISVRVDNQILAEYPFPVANGSLTDTNSLQTGPRNPDFDPAADPIADSWALLGWAKFEVELKDDGKLVVKYKGREVTPAGGLQTTFFPSPGRLVFGGRTGGNNQNTHIDNIAITTVAAAAPLLTSLQGNAAGFRLTLADAQTTVVESSVQVRLNGQSVPAVATRDGNTTTAVYENLASLLASGSTNTVDVTFLDSGGQTNSATRGFVVAPYQLLGAADAVPAASVNTALRGFQSRLTQLPIARFPGDANSIANAERHLANRYVDFATGQPYPNIATTNTLVVDGVLNWNQEFSPYTGATGVEIGSFTSESTPPRPDAGIPGIPGLLPDGVTESTDNIAAEFLTYLELAPGAYTFGVNSDDGFRVTAGAGFRSIFQSPAGSFNGGKGSSDVLFSVVVTNAGIYPFRLAWWEGNSAANVEFFTQDFATGAKTLINDPEVTGAAKAYRQSTAPLGPFPTYATPFPGSGGSLPNPVIEVDFEDGTVALDDGSVGLAVNGSPLSVTVTNAGTRTTVAAPVTTLLAPLSTNTATLTYRGAGGGTTATQTWTFVVGPYATLPTALASPVGSGNAAEPGFKVRTHILDPYLNADGTASVMATSLEWAEAVFAGLAGTNVANLSAFTNGVFNEPTVINYDQAGAAAGAFTNDTVIPGFPGAVTIGDGTDNAVAEIQTYVEFPQAGVYRMGVNSDDGFRATATEGRGGRLLFEVLAPSPVAGFHAAVPSARGVSGGTFGPLPVTPLTADVVYAQPGDACADLTNAAQLAGKIALIDRGTCGFIDKARRAQQAGALAVIFIDNSTAFPIVAAGGTDEITIPVVMISQAVGNALKANQTGLRASLGVDPTPVLGEFNAGRGAAGSYFDGTLFTFAVPQAGVYPLRVLWMEGGGGANVEWYAVTAAGEGILLNNTASPRALKTFRSRTTVDRPQLAVARQGANLSVTFTGTLQEATAVNGTFGDVAGATSPYVVTPAGANEKYYRARQ